VYLACVMARASSLTCEFERRVSGSADTGGTQAAGCGQQGCIRFGDNEIQMDGRSADFARMETFGRRGQPERASSLSDALSNAHSVSHDHETPDELTRVRGMLSAGKLVRHPGQSRGSGFSFLMLQLQFVPTASILHHSWQAR
jgi:hypothetical protein